MKILFRIGQVFNRRPVFFRHFSLAAIVLFFVAGCAPSTPPVAGASEEGRRAFELATRFTEECPERISGTEGAKTAAAWIAARLTESGLKAETQTFSCDVAGEKIVFRNVLATIGEKPRRVLLLSHYDTKLGIPGFVGANDGASSTALLLVLAERFAGAPLKNIALTFAFLDGEESRGHYSETDGLHGSTYLAKESIAKGIDWEAVILCDMIGDKDLHFEIPGNTTPSLARLALQAAFNLSLRDRISRGRTTIIDDHVPFIEHGYPAIDLIDFSYGPNHSWWHSPLDTPDKLAPESFAVTGAIVAEMLRLLDEDASR